MALWVGKTSTQEAFATERADELDAKIAAEGGVTRTREVQEHESDYFQSLFKFKGGIQYVEPVVLSAQVNLRDEEQKTKLYHLKGRRNVRVKQVDVSSKNLNSGDVFVLDANDVIYQWNGSKASRMEKAKALDLTVRLRDERMNRLKASVVLLEEGAEEDKFWTALGGKGPIASADEGGDDAEFEKASTEEVKLFKVSAVDQPANRVDTQGKPLHRRMLESEYTFIVDAHTEIFIWTGRQSPIDVRHHAVSLAKKFLSDNGRPDWTPITKVTEGVENALFKGKFQGAFKEFIDNPDHLAARTKHLNRTAGTIRQEAINVDALHNPEKYSISREDNVSEKLILASKAEPGQQTETKIWVISKNDKVPLPADEYGIFYAGESYIMQYSVQLKSGDWRHIVYYWQGRHSATDDQGACALLATNLSATLGANVHLVRVLQNKEPEHFLSHFDGHMNVRLGSRDKWAEEWKGKFVLFHIRGTNAVDTRAVQMKTQAASLNSNDAFLLKSDSTAFVWLGKGANEFERAVALKIAERMTGGAQNFTTLEEGNESDDFWTAIGGKGEYSNDEKLHKGDIKARLFQCSDSTSVFRVMEIHHFVQDDLDNDDVMILDGYSEVFVWIGSGSTEREKSMGVQLAHDYLKAANDGRPANVPVYAVNSREEPPQFTHYFLGWDDAAAKSGEDLYIRTLEKLSEGGFLQMSSAATAEVNAVHKAKEAYNAKHKDAASSSASPSAAGTAPSGAVYPFDRLKVKPLPTDVDGEHLENHVSDAEFAQFFKMSRADFAAAPKWKQLRIKKDIGLF